MRKIFIKFVKFYQSYISPMLPNSCRYYPSCSEYFIWNIKNDTIANSFIKTTIRIIKCNPFMKFGFDYPVIHKNFIPFFRINNDIFINFWFIPRDKNRYFIIKSVTKGQKC